MSPLTCKSVYNSVCTDEKQMNQLIEENNRLKEEHMCKICQCRCADVVFLPCGHLSCCGQCATVFSSCSVCRQPVKGFLKVFYATVV